MHYELKRTHTPASTSTVGCTSYESSGVWTHMCLVLSGRASIYSKTCEWFRWHGRWWRWKWRRRRRRRNIGKAKSKRQINKTIRGKGFQHKVRYLFLFHLVVLFLSLCLYRRIACHCTYETLIIIRRSSVAKHWLRRRRPLEDIEISLMHKHILGVCGHKQQWHTPYTFIHSPWGVSSGVVQVAVSLFVSLSSRHLWIFDYVRLKVILFSWRECVFVCGIGRCKFLVVRVWVKYVCLLWAPKNNMLMFNAIARSNADVCLCVCVNGIHLKVVPGARPGRVRFHQKSICQKIFFARHVSL